MTLTHPQWLWLAVPLAAGLLFGVRPWRRPWGVRCLATVCLGAAGLLGLAGLGEPRHSVRVAEAVRWAVLVDQRLDGVDRDRQTAWLAALDATRPGHVQVQVVRFGRPGATRSRLAPALLAAAGADRVVLLSDGLFVEPDAELAELAERLGAPIELAAHLPAPRPTLVAHQLRILDHPAPHRPLRAQLDYEAAHDGAAQVALVLEQADGERRTLPALKLLVQPGRATAECRVPPLPPGLWRLTAELTRPGVAPLPHQRTAALLEVGRSPRVLLVGDDPRGGEIDRVLAVSRHHVEHVRPEAMPIELAPLLGYHEVILSGISLAALSPRAARVLASWVTHHGGGLLVTDGLRALDRRSFDASPLAELLPLVPEKVDPPPEDPPPDDPPPPPLPRKDPRPARGKVAKPVLTLVLLIDASGSMEGLKIELAKAAAIACLQTLHPEDIMGVVAFDEKPLWLVRPTAARRRRQIAERIGRLQAGGDTHIHRALESAQRQLKGIDTAVKHVVLLSDGHTEPALFRQLVTQMARDRVTVSTIGIGTDFDQQLLQQIAGWGHGQFNFASDPQEVPQYVIKETRRALVRAAPMRNRAPKKPRDPKTPRRDPKTPRRDPITPRRDPQIQPPAQPPVDPAQQPHPVRAVFRSPLLGGLRGRLPGLRRLIPSRPRNGATVFLETDDDDRLPVLAAWRAGLGRVGVFASALEGRDAGDWPAWKDYPRLVAQLVSYLLSEGPSEALTIDSRLGWRGARLRLDLRIEGRDGTPWSGGPIEVVERFDGGGRLPRPDAHGPGRHRLELAPAGDHPVWTVRIGRAETHLIAHRPPPPYAADRARLRALAAAAGGRTSVEADQLQAPLRSTPRERPIPASPLLGLAAALTSLGAALWRVARRPAAATG